MGNREFAVHITVDGHEHPTFAWVYSYLDNGQVLWLGDQEFGPFDTLTDVHRWLYGLMRRNRVLPTS